ncbi:MAG: hypothetical protein F6K47_02830 [Symploca sp. SIO2E6]|nr:hypothetical protein [Symploca sp. SIO2E6]
MNDAIGWRLEQYTIKYPQEVLIVTAEIAGVEDQIAIYKGFSSSLMSPTAFDPDVPVLPPQAKIINIDRVASPYNPNTPHYLQQGINGEAIEKLLSDAGV